MNKVKFFKSISDLNHITMKYQHVYLYGAGMYGGIFKFILDANKVETKGFLVTDKGSDEYLGLPVFTARYKIGALHDECCVILSVSKKFYKKILNNNKFKCDVYCIENGFEDVFLRSPLPFIGFLDKIGRRYTKKSVKKICDGGSILIVQVEFTFGDVIWSTALVRELRSCYPNSKISFIINENMVQLINNCPHIDEIIPYPLARKEEYILPSDLYINAKDFSKKIVDKYDAVLLPRLLPFASVELWENVFISQFVDSKNIFAHALTHTNELNKLVEYYEPFFSKIIKHTDAEHEVKRNLSLVSAIGGVVKNDKMELWTDLEADNYAKILINEMEDEICIAVGLVGSKPVRSWPAIKYNELFKKIKKFKPNVRFILCGGLDARDAAFTSVMGNEAECVNITGKTSLSQIIAVIKYCNFYIGSDTGLMHIASAYGKPIIEISHSLPDSPETYGSSPIRTGPWRVPNIVFRPPYALGTCKYNCSEKTAHCISLIEVNDVFKAAINFIDMYG